MKKFRKIILTGLFAVLAVALSASFFTAAPRVTASATWKTETESSNPIDNASEIEFDTTVEDNLSSRDDIKWYKFTISEYGRVSIYFRHEVVNSTSYYWTFSVYRADGVTCLFSDSVKGKNGYYSMLPLALDVGDYYLKVSKGSVGYSEKTYNITMKYEKCYNWEVESNGTKDNADEIVSDVIHGNLYPAGDVDWYKFTATEDGYLAITFSYKNLYSQPKSCWKFELFYSEGITHYGGTNVFYVYGTGHGESVQIGASAGTYYLKVSQGEAYSNVDYDLYVYCMKRDNWESGDNNTCETAEELICNTALYGSIVSSVDVDWYKVTIPKDGYITVDFKHESVYDNDYYWLVYMYLSDGTTYYDNTKKSWSIDGNNGFSSNQMGVSAGVYYLKVCKYDSALSWATYNITVNYTESTDWETEDNNTYDKADEITCNKSYYGNLSTEKDEDWYKFNLSANCDISISFSHDVFDDDRTHWWVYLLKSDPFLDNVTDFYVYGNSDKTSDFITLSAGVYYIKITDGFYHSPLTYSFSVTVKHDHVGIWTVTTPPTCIASGTETKICTVCGHSETREVPMTEHTRDNGKIVKKTTIFQIGEIEYTCTFCGEKEIVKDKSKVWVLPVIIVGVVVVVIGLINYIKMMKKKD